MFTATEEYSSFLKKPLAISAESLSLSWRTPPRICHLLNPNIIKFHSEDKRDDITVVKFYPEVFFTVPGTFRGRNPWEEQFWCAVTWSRLSDSYSNWTALIVPDRGRRYFQRPDVHRHLNVNICTQMKRASLHSQGKLQVSAKSRP